jgi:hypothetical protein
MHSATTDPKFDFCYQGEAFIEPPQPSMAGSMSAWAICHKP